MARVERSIVLKMTADEAWAILGDFGDMSWHPMIADTSLRHQDGHTDRIIIVAATGGQAIERLTGSQTRGYSYDSISTPSPTQNYRAMLRVEDDGGNARVVWTSSFDPKGVSEEDACAFMRRVYDAGLNALPGKIASAG